MARVYKIKNPATNVLNDIPLEDNAALLSGYCSDAGTISNGKLLAYDGSTLLPLYESGSGFTTEEMPIGAHIYVYIDNTNSSWSDEDVNSLKAYDSYYEVPLSNNGVEFDSTFGNKFSNYDSVWLEVYLSSDHTRWYPVGITGSTGLHSKGLYIYLGSYTGDVNSQSHTDADKFMLETKNEMYYYDNGVFTPFNLWELDNQVGWIEAQLAAI